MLLSIPVGFRTRWIEPENLSRLSRGHPNNSDHVCYIKTVNESVNVCCSYIAHVNITCEINWISEIWNESCKPWIIQALLVPKFEKEIKIAESVEIISCFLFICWLYVTWTCVYPYKCRLWHTSLISIFFISLFVKYSQHIIILYCHRLKKHLLLVDRVVFSGLNMFHWRLKTKWPIDRKSELFHKWKTYRVIKK